MSAPAALHPRPVPAHPPGALRQVTALIRLRVAAVRGRRRRRAAALGLGLVPVLFVAAAATGTRLPADLVTNATLLMPSAMLLFAVAATLAATTGGGRMLLTRDETVAFPVSPTADHLGAVLLAPLNLSWLVQALGLVTLAAWVSGGAGGLAAAEAVTLTWLLVATVIAQAVGWAVELARTTTLGQWAVRVVAAACVGAAIALALEGRLLPMLDQAPTVPIVGWALDGAYGRWAAWGRGLAQLAVLGGAAWCAGVVLARWLRRRPARAQVRVEARVHPGRADPRSDLRAALRIDRASVWRSVPLRRGLVALGAIPGLAAAAARLEWPLIALLPGLVASGAGLLFGVNAFSLDGRGALWRETLPGSPRTLLTARMITVAEVCLAGTLLALLAAVPRAPELPTAAELLAVAGAVIGSTAQVVSHCLVWSLDRPYAAGLREARDQPAPPAAMAWYSARLAVFTTTSGLAFCGLARAGATSAVIALTLALVCLALRRGLAAARRWDHPEVRCRVVATVAGASA